MDIKQVCNGPIFACSVHVWLFFFLSTSLLAVKSVHVPSSVTSLRLYRSLPPSLQRDSTEIAVLFVTRNKKQHLFTEAFHIVTTDLLAKMHPCNHLSNNRGL